MSPRAPSERALIGLLAAITATGPFSLGIYMPVVPLARVAFGVSVAEASVTVSLPMLAFAIGLFVCGPLSDHYGRRGVILGGLATYVVGAVISLVAPSIGVLTVGRVILVLGTSAGVTVARAAMGDLYAHERMAAKLATLTMVMITANTLAPAIGGVLAEALGWRAVFALLLLAGIAIAVTATRYLPETRPASASRRPREVLDGTLLLVKKPLFLAHAAQGAILYTVFFVFIALVPYLFHAYGRSAAEYGLWYPLLSGGYFLGNWHTSRHIAREGAARLYARGVILQAAGAVAGVGLALAGFWHPAFLFLPWVLIGFGQGLLLPTLTAGAVSLAPGHPGAAMGLLGFSQQIVGALAVQAIAFAPATTPVPVTALVAAGGVLGALLLWLGPRAPRQPAVAHAGAGTG